MSKMTLAWLDAQIEQELERGNHPDAVRDLAALVTVRNHLCNKQHVAKVPVDNNMVHPYAQGFGMRDHNEIAIGEYKDQRSGTMAKPMHHHEEEQHHMHEEREHQENAMPLDKETVMAWVDGMLDSDGVHGGKYSWHQAQQHALNKGITGHQRQLEFYAAMNAMYSDFHEAGKKFGCDRPEFYACLAKLFIEDPDAVEDKVSAYYHHVVKHDT